jgi:tRNA nucleotidyltransferase (CCA-adding enzyme)
MMARRAQHYPQVEIGAAGLVDTAVAAVPASSSMTEALGMARRHNVHALVAGDMVVLREDLARAASLRVGGARATMLARPVPIVDGRASEVVVRRHLAAGAPLVVVREGRRFIGGVASSSIPRVAVSLADRLARRVQPAVLAALGALTRAAAARDARAFLAGGVVRDALDGRPLASPDLDVVVEGDGPGVARWLAQALDAPLREHARFLTATVGPTAAGRIDIATARSERYEARGALPRVMPSSIEQDLRRRDFTVNAMAVELASGTFGLLDQHGGRVDLAARRLRILHPASFVEDPTRIFRAARYAARLGLRADVWTTGCEAWALSLAPYPALSGARILAELERLLGDARPATALVRLGIGGAYRLLDTRYRFTRGTRAAVPAVPATLAWAQQRGLDLVATELLVVALLTHQESDVVAAALRRLEMTGEPRARVGRAIAESDALRRAVGRQARASERARLLRGCSALELAWVWLGDDAGGRARIESFVDAGAVRGSLRGTDVIALGVPAGPRVAAALDALRDARLDGQVAGRAEEEVFVRAWSRGDDGHPGGGRDHSSRKER